MEGDDAKLQIDVGVLLLEKTVPVDLSCRERLENRINRCSLRIDKREIKME